MRILREWLYREGLERPVSWVDVRTYMANNPDVAWPQPAPLTTWELLDAIHYGRLPFRFRCTPNWPQFQRVFTEDPRFVCVGRMYDPDRYDTRVQLLVYRSRDIYDTDAEAFST